MEQEIDKETGEIIKTAEAEQNNDFQSLINRPLGDAFSSIGEFESYQRMAKMLAVGNMIPDRFRGKVGDCVIALNMANRMKIDVMEVMQGMYVVYGQPSFSATFIISRINQSGRYKGELDFVYNGEKTECTAVAIKQDGTEVAGATITMAMAKAEGWLDKNGSKWKTMPEQMLMYRAATFFARKYCPDLIFGYLSVDEAKDIGPQNESADEPTQGERSEVNDLLKPVKDKLK